MKKLAIVTSISLLFSLNAAAENIDGTLAVDANNQLTNVQQTATNAKQRAEATLSANVDSAGENMKATEQATSVPVSTPTVGSSTMEGPFVGIEANGVLSSSAEGVDASGMSFGLRFGAQNVDWRTMAVLERFSNNGEANAYTRGLLQLDYFFLGMDNLMIDTYGIRPYAGLNAGLLSMDTTTKNVKSLTYGAQAGATMNVTSNIDLDLGYRYNLSSGETVDHTSGVSVGLHFKY